VMAMRKPSVSSTASPPRYHLFPAGPSAQTNDLGEFRLFGLPPGEYLVQATAREAFPESPAPRGTTMLPTYFPATPDPLAAQPITVGAGQTSAEVVIRMVAASAFQVSGVVRDEAGRPVANAMVRLMTDRPVMARMGRWDQSRTDTSGTFTINNVTNGEYTLLAAAPVTISGPAHGRPGAVAVTRGGFTSSLELIAEANAGGVITETRNGITIQYRDDTATRLPITVNDANVSGLDVIVRVPAR
jgi:hypothetical protein